MRPPTILDIVQAVTEVAPFHPEVAVWWYERRGTPGAPAVQLVLEGKGGVSPDTVSIGVALADRLSTREVAVRTYRGAAEGHTLYRLLTADDARAGAGSAKGW